MVQYYLIFLTLLLPYTPSGDGYERVHTLSSSPGAVLLVILVPDEARAILVKIFVFDETSVGRSAPLHPSGDGCERVHTLSRSPGAILLGS